MRKFETNVVVVLRFFWMHQTKSFSLFWVFPVLLRFFVASILAASNRESTFIHLLTPREILLHSRFSDLHLHALCTLHFSLYGHEVARGRKLAF